MNRTLVKRYGPFMILIALQLMLVTLSDGSSDVVAGPDLGANGFSTGTGSGTGSGFSTGTVAAGAGTGAAAGGSQFGGSGSGVAGGGQTTAPGGSAGAGDSGGGSVNAPDAAGGGGNVGGGGGGAATQKLDQLGRPMEGDRSQCGEGGQVQESVTLQSPPCIPRLNGPNGGATYQGVTEDKIRIVISYPEYGAGVQQVLAANELAMTKEQAEEVHSIYKEFFEKHYNFYGRQLELIHHSSPAADAISLRAEAKAVVQKHKPFAVMYYVQSLMPMVQVDEYARSGVVVIGAPEVADEFYLERAPFVWSGFAQGYRLVDLAADYYCKRMHGKMATEAGDPAMRVMTRKLGVGSSENPDVLKRQQRFIAQVTGGMCGSPNDGVTLYTYSADPETAENQQPALVSRMKADGITTLFGTQVCAEGDKQGYFPEIFYATMVDDDYVGRVFAALCGPTQMQNVFGIGMYPHAGPRNSKEFYHASKEINPSFEPPYLAEGPFQGLAFTARLLQFAGPNLTPQSVYQGSRTIPQIAGWDNANPWPGWVCCNKYAPMHHVGLSADSFSSKADARQIYWDGSAISEGDGGTGAWVGVDDSRRYGVGQWPPGEPKQP